MHCCSLQSENKHCRTPQSGGLSDHRLGQKGRERKSILFSQEILYIFSPRGRPELGGRQTGTEQPPKCFGGGTGPSCNKGLQTK